MAHGLHAANKRMAAKAKATRREELDRASRNGLDMFCGMPTIVVTR